MKQPSKLFGAMVAILSLLSTVEAQVPVNPNASQGVKDVLCYLHNLKGNAFLSGQHDYVGLNTYYNQMHSITGKYPALWGSDFAYGANVFSKRNDLVTKATQIWNAGSLVTMTYHQVMPGNPETSGWSKVKVGNNGITDQEYNDIVTPGTALYNDWLAAIDNVAGHLKTLRDNGVVVLWRPYHEHNLRGFWWCRREFKQLWINMYDRYTNHHGLNNLIWVWNFNTINQWAVDPTPYFPGSQYVDMLTVDDYSNIANIPSSQSYGILQTLANGKPIAIGENGQNPDPTFIKNNRPDLVYHMTWPLSDPMVQNNTNAWINSTYSNSYTFTQDEVNVPASTCSSSSSSGGSSSSSSGGSSSSSSGGSSSSSSGGSTTYQSSAATIGNGSSSSTSLAGYTGSNYIDFGGNGSWANWSNVTGDGNSATITFRYANGSTGNRQAEIKVNGSSVGNVSFSPTGSWTTWTDVSITATLNNNSTNTVRVTANTGSGGPNLDRMVVALSGGGSSSSSGGGGPLAFQGSSNQVVMEAESFMTKASGQSRSWNEQSISGASGGKTMQATPDSGTNLGDATTGPRLDFTVNFATSGNYYVYIRGMGPSTLSDSIHVGLNGSPVSYGGNGFAFIQSSLVWKDDIGGGGPQNIQVNVPSAGIHTFNLWMREDGVHVDKIVLKKTSGLPSGTGPSESPIQ